MSGDRSSLEHVQKGFNHVEKAQIWLEASQIAAHQGDLVEARRLLQAAIEADPTCAEAWFRLGQMEEDPQERARFFRQVLAFEPENPQAQAELSLLESSHAPDDSDLAPTLRSILAVLTLVASLALLAILVWGPVDESLAWLMPLPTPTAIPAPTRTPGEIAAQFESQLEAAIAEGRWERAVDLVATMRGVDPTGLAVQEWAHTTHLHYGQALVDAGAHTQALEQFSTARSFDPENDESQTWQEAAQLFLQGQEAVQAEEWDKAIEAFEKVQERVPDYGDVVNRTLYAYRFKGEAALAAGDNMTAIEALSVVREAKPQDQYTITLLAQAYFQRGVHRHEKSELKNARADLEAALALQPDNAEIQTRLDRVMEDLFPPKRIEINISTQRFYAYEGDRLVYNWPTSTGLRGRDTAAGHFKVQSKIEMAWSSIWQLKMPYWLGIYNVGRVENGIHALPIRTDGSVMWGGLLGQRASYGCVILSTQAAKTLFNWAEIGTPVWIHY